jgi:hypothetical protein
MCRGNTRQRTNLWCNLRNPGQLGFFDYITKRQIISPASCRVNFYKPNRCPAVSWAIFCEYQTRLCRVKKCTEKARMSSLTALKIEKENTRPIEELHEIQRKIEKEMKEEAAKTKKFLAELFLAGPDAWPDNNSC